MVNDIAGHIQAKKIGKLVDRLNLPNTQSLDAEWEAAVLYALSYLGKITHEPQLRGTSKIDLLFQSTSNDEHEFLADITTISDEGRRRQNPIDFLASEFSRLLDAVGLSAEGYHIQIGHENVGSATDFTVRLKLPYNKDITQILESEVPKFVANIVNDRNNPKVAYITSKRMDIKITYNPLKSGFGMVTRRLTCLTQ